MHELSIMYNVVRSVEEIAKENDVKVIDTLVLQIGEISPVVPHFIEACYPAAVDGTMMENTKLEIEMIPANGRCKECEQVFNVVEHKRTCPNCGEDNWELLTGREFMIKEIVAC